MMISSKAILVGALAKSDAVASKIGEIAKDWRDVRIDLQISDVAAMSRTAGDLFPGAHALIVEVDPMIEAEVEGLRRLVATRPQGLVMLALTAGDVPLSDARRLMRSGVDDVLASPFSRKDIAESIEIALKRDAEQLSTAAPQRDRGKVVGIVGARGGVGASTVAVNIALALKGRRRRKDPPPKVALVDLDVQFGTVGLYLDIEESDAMVEIARSQGRFDATYLQALMVEHKSGLDVLTAPPMPIPMEALRSSHIGDLLDELGALYDYVVVDIPHALPTWLEAALRRLDLMLLVTNLSVPAIRHARRLIDVLTDDLIGLPIQVVVNRDSRSIWRSRSISQAEQALGRGIDHWIAEDSATATEAINTGQPPVENRSRSTLARSIRRVMEASVASLAASAPPQSRAA